ATDVARAQNDRESVSAARKSMVGITVLGLLVALGILYIPRFGLQQLWWVFNTIAACVMVPTILSLYYQKLSERGVFWGVLVSFVVGVPLFIYSNLVGHSAWIVGSSVLVVAITTLFSLL